VRNTATCTQTITVDDTISPTITCPANASAVVNVPADYTATATDNCPGTPVFSYSVVDTAAPDAFVFVDLTGGSYRITLTADTTCTITVTATDPCGNATPCQQIVSLNDVTPPVITCPGPVAVECPGRCSGPNTSLVTATDDVSTPTVTFVSDSPSGTCPTVITRTYRRRTRWGTPRRALRRSRWTTRLRHDRVPGPVAVQCTADIPAPDVVLVTATDNCGVPTVTHVGDASDGLTCPETITRTYQATDTCGNTATCTQTITVSDTVAPQITCPVAMRCSASAAFRHRTSGQCRRRTTAARPRGWVSDVSNGLTCPETITRTYEVMDGCGNTATCTQTITVDDTIAPQITCPGAIAVQCLSDVPAANVSLVTATDNCGVPIVTFAGDVSNGLTCPETITRTYLAMDACGTSGPARRRSR